jgi:PAS domain S-box-containing protein
VTSSVKILLLEDDFRDAELIQELLEADHLVCKVTRVQTRTEFLTALENDEIDLILSDYKLPSFDGLSALKLTSSARPDLPFIFVSGTLGEELAIEALKIGATDYVLKTKLSRLMPSVRRALREAGERAEWRKAEEARQRAEHAVQANERRFRALIEHAYDVVLLSSAEGTILYASPSVQMMLGYAPEELIGRSGYDLVHPDHRQESINRMTQSMEQAGAVVRGERLLLHRDGSPRWVENVIVNLFSEPSVQAAVLHLRDITERKQAEAALRDSEQRFRDFADSASDWYWETGPDHRFITHLVSELQLETIGVLIDSRIGTVRWHFARDLQEEPEKWRQHIADLNAHKPFRDFRYRAASRDGSEVYISASGKPLFDLKGNFLGYRGVASHITAAVRAALLEEALQEAKVVGDNIAHDLRTPLTRVRLRLERGREHAATLEEMRNVADQAIAGLDQSLATITALLRITEIEHSRRREGFSDVQLAPLIREAADLYDPIAENKGVTLRVEAPDGAAVRGDRDLLFEAVANLVDNAVKFTPEGGRVELALLHREGETVIRVSDTGPGIPEIEREAVTQRFYRSDKTRNTKGLGLGLSMVAAIIKLHSFRFGISAGPGCTVEIACPQVD